MTHVTFRLIPYLLVTAAALIGAAAGGATGAVANEKQIDLSQPVWRRDGGPQA